MDLPADLSVVIPVCNAESTLERVVGDALSVEAGGLSVQVILIDDASSDGSAALAARLSDRHRQVLALRHRQNRGAGVARMTGWPHVRGRYTLFFDADDILHVGALRRAVDLLEAHPQADTAMLAYRYERGQTNTGIEMSWQDTGVFRRLLADGAPAVAPPDRMADLLLVTNYPWNKVIRTAHFRAVGLRFGSTRVNNDIRGHWEMILKARQVLVTDEVICTHIVERDGINITNRFGPERLEMLDALADLHDWLQASPELRHAQAHRFWLLAHRLVCWARERLDPALLPVLEARWSALIERIDLADYAEMRLGRAPELANALANQLLDQQGLG